MCVCEYMSCLLCARYNTNVSLFATELASAVTPQQNILMVLPTILVDL